MSDSPNRSRLKRKTTSRVLSYREPTLDNNDLFGPNDDDSDGYIVGTPKKKRRSESNSRTNTNSPSSTTPNSSGSTASNKKFKYQRFLHDKTTQWNLIPLLPPSYRKTSKFSNVLDLDEAFVDTKAQIVYNTEAVLLERDESIYMVSEPPGEPYYIGRVVEFIAKPEFAEEIKNTEGQVTKYPVRFFNVKMNWYYRPRDIQEDVTSFDSRKVYASLHQDICPINSYRGKCTVVHKAELQDVLPNEREEIVRSNVFYFDSLFDRYTRQYYTVYPTSKLLNNFKSIPSFLYALEKKHRYVYTEEKYPLLEILSKYVFKESTKDNKNIDIAKDVEAESNNTTVKESKTWDKRCQECHEWCLPDNSLECDDCGGTMHLYCMDPPLSKKPGKKIAWVCSFCVKKQSTIPDDKNDLSAELERVEIFNQQCRDFINKKAADSISKSFDREIERHWFQYIGCYIISHMSDILDDILYLPYPFKLSRYGEKYQWSKCFDRDASSMVPYDRNKSDERGTKDSVTLLWVADKDKISDANLNTYVEKCKDEIAPLLDVQSTSCNFLDFVVKALIANDYHTDRAFLDCMNNMSRPVLHEPTFTADEIKKFEEGVRKYGSELRPVWKHVETQPMSMIVRFYYNWKKTERGMKIRGKKNPEKSQTISASDSHSLTVVRSVEELSANRVPVLNNGNETDDVEMRYMDDSSFDTDRFALLETSFHCLFCNVNYSPMWYKVTGGSDDENSKKRLQTGVNEKTEQSDKAVSKKQNNDNLGALCIRCARLWRRYAIRWVHPLDVVRKMHGACVSSYHNALELILDETNINKLTLSPERAQKKYLEWELVQDAELITRQRWEIMKDHKKFNHMKKQSMVFHGILTKTVRRPYNKYLYRPEKLHSDLSSFIAERCDSTFNISVGNSAPVTDENIQLPSESTENQANIDKPSQNVTNQHVNDIHTIKNRNVSQGDGTSDITVSFETDEFQGLEVTVDNKFKNVTLNSKVVEMLLNDSTDIPEKILNQLKNDFASVVPSSSILNSGLQSNDLELPRYYSQFTSERDTLSQLKGYQMMVSPVPPSDPKTREKKSTKAKISKCNVCYASLFYPSNGIQCHSCGLICHKSCYGKNVMNLKRGEDWFCDVCSNQMNPTVSTIYTCRLCYSPQNTQNEGPTHKPTIKPSSDGCWCHIVCSLFNDTIKYGNPGNLEPAINVNEAIWKRRNQKCMMCNRSGGGLVQCDECPDYFHVTCAQSDKHFKLLFKKELLPDNALDTYTTIINDQESNTKYTLTPVLVCGNHNVQNVNNISYHNLSSTISNHFTIDIYSNSSKSSAKRNAVFSKYNEMHYNKELLHDSDIPDGFQSNESNVFVIRKNQKCRSCGNNNMAFWYEPDLCHSCHVGGVSGDKTVIDKANRSDVNVVSHYISYDVKKQLLENIDPDSARLS